jgi:hypothetical protein
MTETEQMTIATEVDEKVKQKMTNTNRQAQADLLLVHPGIDSQAVQGLLREYWPDGDLTKSPEGYREINSVFPGLRAFCLADREIAPQLLDSHLTERVRKWVDLAAQRWNFPEVFKARELNFWAFLRDRLIMWLEELIQQRQALEALAGEEDLVILAAGVDDYQRILLRQMTERMHRRIRAEIAYIEHPVIPPVETIVGRRFRKGFFMVQDAWHGIKFLLSDLFSSKPKLLLLSDNSSWKRRRGEDGKWLRTDIHMEGVWRKGRRYPLRLFYRSENYHPDVGAMTQGSLAPTYLQHFLFILAQTSRGFWEIRRIQRKWDKLRANPEFISSLEFDGHPLGELVLQWLVCAVEADLPKYVRDTRRETHFLKGIRPAAILMSGEQDSNRPVLVAARKLGIPTVALQLAPYPKWDETYITPQSENPCLECRPDRYCVFSADAKRELVEQGCFDPAAIVVTGDPRLDVVSVAGEVDETEAGRMRSRFGVEAGQKIVAVACSGTDRAQLFEWLGQGISANQKIFLLIQLPHGESGEIEAFRQAAAVNGLRWIHIVSRARFDEALFGVDALVTTGAREVAEGLLNRIPVMRVVTDPSESDWQPDPGDLIENARSAADIKSFCEGLLHEPSVVSIDETKRTEFLESVYGRLDGGGADKILDTLMQLIED